MNDLVFIGLLASSLSMGAAETLQLKNSHIQIEFSNSNAIWKMTRIARADESEALNINSDEFEILLFDDSRFTVADYQVVGKPWRTEKDGFQILEISFQRKKDTNPNSPQTVRVSYSLGDSPWIHKSVNLKMKEGEKIDRLAVQRFSGTENFRLGGRGQPLIIGNWWFGMDYPCFYSRHTDGFRNPDYYYRWDYMIDLQGRDRIFAPREHLATIFHFPGFAIKQVDATWGIRSKRAVFGISEHKGDNAELGLLDYINTTRKPTRSYLHFNNWYSREAKKLTMQSFIENTYRPIAAQLKKYGAKLDGMVPDHGWETMETRIFEPQLNSTHEPLPELRKALKADGSGLGIWMALDGTNQRFQKGLDIGYRPAYGEGFDRTQFRWMTGKPYYDILQPKYFNDLKKALHFLITEAKVDYIKHDFNHNFTSNYITQRHAREKCLDATLEIIAYERSLNPNLFINYTNGAWFSPFWLQRVDCLWMMTGDSGGSRDWPHISLREGATTYRCKYFYRNFNNSGQRPRPVIPIANFMTHGILLSHRKPFTDFKDTLHDWADYVVMYLARGTTLKELYLDLDLLDDDHWKVLATTSRWAALNQTRLMNTLMVGGDPAKGQVYGYLSWVDNKAIFSVRNPDRRLQRMNVPFDRSVYFRGNEGKPYRMRAIYPYVEDMPWKLTSGQPFSIDAAGDTVIIYEIEPGQRKSMELLTPQPIPPAKSSVSEKRFSFEIGVPDEAFKRHDLLIQYTAMADTSITINGHPLSDHRVNSVGRWTVAMYDLRTWRGKDLKIEGQLIGVPSANVTGKRVRLNAWLIVDRKVNAPLHNNTDLPFLISQEYRRITQHILKDASIVVATSSNETKLAIKLIEAQQKKKQKR